MVPIGLIYIYWLLLSAIATGYAELQNESQLASNCYDFPTIDFGKSNNVRADYGSSPKVLLTAGGDAIDFTLPDSRGKLVQLSDLLNEKPVLLLWGHYTCPAFQGLNSDTMFVGSSYAEEYRLVELVKDVVTVVHLVGPEPHPRWPNTNFDSGSIKMNLWSTPNQPRSFAERMQISVPPILKYLHDDVILLIDYLDGPNGVRNNPVWCSYANGARSAVLIGQDGVIKYTQNWFNSGGMIKAIAENT